MKKIIQALSAGAIAALALTATAAKADERPGERPVAGPAQQYSGEHRDGEHRDGDRRDGEHRDWRDGRGDANGRPEWRDRRGEEARRDEFRRQEERREEFRRAELRREEVRREGWLHEQRAMFYAHRHPRWEQVRFEHWYAERCHDRDYRGF